LDYVIRDDLLLPLFYGNSFTYIYNELSYDGIF
jgi:hypothetical protein